MTVQRQNAGNMTHKCLRTRYEKNSFLTERDNCIRKLVTIGSSFKPLNFLFVILFLITGLYLLWQFKYHADDHYLTNHEWKAGGGYNPSDWLSFDGSKYYKVQNDTLYKRDTAVAVISSFNRAIFGDNELNIKSLKTGELGMYYEK